MADETDNTTGATGPVLKEQLEKLEGEKVDLLRSLVVSTRSFMGIDERVTSSFADLLSTLVDHAKAHPDQVFSGGRGNIDELLGALNAAMRSKGDEKDIEGHDIVGGADWGTLADVIEKIGDFISKEKKFFIAILLLIFCNDTACGCLCDYIKTP